jgi:ethanolamine utilization protein EutN
MTHAESTFHETNPFNPPSSLDPAWVGARFASLTHPTRKTMFVAKVTGSLVSTQKVDSMKGYKLLVVEPYRVDPDERKSLITTGRTFVAVDMLGAGVGDYVLLTQGSSARLTPETKNMPIDAVIIGIVDQVHVDQNSVYSREK